MAFSKKRRLRRIQIFSRSLRVFQKPAAEGDHFADVVANRKHDSPTKAIVSAGPLAGRALYIIPGFCKAARNEFASLVTMSARPAAKRVPLIRSVAKLPMFGDFRRDPALF